MQDRLMPHLPIREMEVLRGYHQKHTVSEIFRSRFRNNSTGIVLKHLGLHTLAGSLRAFQVFKAVAVLGMG